MAGDVLSHDDRGDGPVVVLVHGHPFDRTMWATQLETLSGSLRVIAMDLPGYGTSMVRPGSITMRELADAVVGLVDALGVERFTVAGLSMGGLVAMELGLGYPDRVDGVILAATTAAPVTADEAAARRATADEIERDGILSVALEMTGKLLGPNARRDTELVTGLFAMMMRTPPVGAAAALRGRAERPDYSVLLRDLQAPALVIAGDHDAFAPEPITQQLIASLPDPEVVRMPGCGHLPNLEDPVRFDNAVKAFVTSRG